MKLTSKVRRKSTTPGLNQNTIRTLYTKSLCQIPAYTYYTI